MKIQHFKEDLCEEIQPIRDAGLSNSCSFLIHTSSHLYLGRYEMDGFHPGLLIYTYGIY